jgi:hypothetical protein
MNRRELLKSSVLSGAAVLLSAKSNRAMADRLPTGGDFPPSPGTRPFVAELRRMPTKTSLPGGRE